MLTRQILKLPWAVSVPVLVLGALGLAIGLHLVAGTYFQRTFLDEVDPLKDVIAAPAPAAAAPVAPAAAPAVGAPASATAQPAAEGMAAAQTAPATQAPAPPGPAVLAEGVFVDGDPGHNGEGRARLIRGADGTLTLRFESFSVTNGPDLFVILSTDPAGSRGSAAAADALNLGRLRATDGNVNYTVPEGTDVAAYKSVIIYCRAFKVVFAVATLEAR